MRAHTTSKQELDALRSVIARDFQDAALTGLSEDRRFAIAYNAALQLAKTHRRSSSLSCASD